MNVNELHHILIKKENEKLFGEDIDHPDDPVPVGKPFDIKYSDSCRLLQSAFKDRAIHVALR